MLLVVGRAASPVAQSPPHMLPHLPPPAVRVNDTDALNEEEGGENDDYIDFDDISGEAPAPAAPISAALHAQRPAVLLSSAIVVILLLPCV